MAEITEIRTAYDMSPVLAGFIGAGVLVVAVVTLVFVWMCCRRRYLRGVAKLAEPREAGQDGDPDPPYRLIHMLKGVSIYPETLGGGGKRIVRRLAPRQGHQGNRQKGIRHACVQVDADGGPPEAPGQGGDGRAPAPPEGEQSVRAGAPASSPESSWASQTSSGSSASGPDTPPGAAAQPDRGSLTLALDYSFPKKALMVTVLQAQGLPPPNPQAGTADPYVKMTILPDRKHRVKTRVLRNTLDPAFDETFSFYGVPYSALTQLTLHLLVLSFDRFSRDDVIGETVVPLAAVDLSTGKVQITQPICKRSAQCVSRGELLVSLSYQPVSHRLSVVVLKARSLPRIDRTGLSANPYVKVNVFYGRKRMAKKKTHVKKGTLDPVFNESFIYDVPAELLPDICIEFLVIDFDRTTKNEVLGRVVLGPHSPVSSGALHWQEVCQHPRRQVSKWHSLSEY